MKTGLRSKVASKADGVLKLAQEDKVPPKVTDPGPPGAAQKPAPKPVVSPSVAPAAPTPPVPPKPPMDKGVVEKDEEGKIRQEKRKDMKVEEIGEKLENFSEQMSTIVDAISGLKKVVEKALLGKGPAEDKLQEFKDKEKKEVKKDNLSAQEFGIESPKITSKEETMDLRSARKNRLYKNVGQAKQAAADEKVETISEEFKEDEAKDKTFKPNAPAPTITKVKESEVPEMFELEAMALDLSESRDKWIVLQAKEGQPEVPLFEINVSDSTKEKFASEEFGKGILLEMEKNGVQNTLDKYGAVKIKVAEVVQGVPKVETEVEAAPAEQTKVEEPQELPKSAAADYRLRFNRALRLALRKMAKNLMANPLKAALFNRIASLNPDLDAMDIVNALESAFHSASDEHFEVALAETDKLMDLSDEAFVELESSISDIKTDVPKVEASSRSGLSAVAQAMRAKASKNSLPLSTVSAKEEDALESKLERVSRALPLPKNFKR